MTFGLSHKARMYILAVLIAIFVLAALLGRMSELVAYLFVILIVLLIIGIFLLVLAWGSAPIIKFFMGGKR